MPKFVDLATERTARQLRQRWERGRASALAHKPAIAGLVRVQVYCLGRVLWLFPPKEYLVKTTVGADFLVYNDTVVSGHMELTRCLRFWKSLAESFDLTFVVENHSFEELDY